MESLNSDFVLDCNNPKDSKFCKECATPLSGVGKIAHAKTLKTHKLDKLIADRNKILEELGRGGIGIMI